MNKCVNCQSPFQITDSDRAFCQKMEVPEPTKCPECRLVRLMRERNSRNLYRRKCDFSGKTIISQYHEQAPFPVYDQNIWWSDQWDATDYGRDFDFNRPFFDQFKELKNKVPHMSVFIIGGTLENSEYTNCTGYLKNCYLIAEADYNEDCYYSNRVFKSNNIVDSTNCHKSDVLYECIDCNTCFDLKYSQECINCSNSWFLQNCSGVKNSIACINQRQKEFMIFNEQYTEDEYQKVLKSFKLDTREGIMELQKMAAEFFKTQPYRFVIGEKNQNVVGDHVYNSKDALN